VSPNLPDLVIDDVTVRFGGLVAVHRLSLTAHAGHITGLLGPNGAGKTTTFNACTGVVSTSNGTIKLGRTRLDGHSTASRASMGLGRTFQRMELFDSMTVAENIAIGPEAAFSSRRPWGQLVAPRRERVEIASRVDAALTRCRIGHLAGRTAGDLSTGERRLVELGRAIASPFRFLLLDEPSSGLDVHETEDFARVLLEHVAETGIGLLLVEHDMALISAVCDYIHVMDFGRKICEGPTAETLASEAVRAAYLGSEAPILAAAEAESA
jgi:ABC-type branched-subunit amino acid transport system ATPase component